jgi:hypothetical protein
VDVKEVKVETILAVVMIIFRRTHKKKAKRAHKKITFKWSKSYVALKDIWYIHVYVLESCRALFSRLEGKEKIIISTLVIMIMKMLITDNDIIRWI